MTPEGKVKEWLRDCVKRRYGHFPGFWHYCPPGGRFGQAGTGDDVWLIDHVFIMIESKSGENGSVSPTKLQLQRLRTIDAGGGVAASMIGKDMTKLQQIFDEIDRRRAIWHRALADEASGKAIEETIISSEG